MKQLERRIADIEKRQGPKDGHGLRIFRCPVGTIGADYEAFRRRCVSEASPARAMIIRFVQPGDIKRTGSTGLH